MVDWLIGAASGLTSLARAVSSVFPHVKRYYERRERAFRSDVERAVLNHRDLSQADLVWTAIRNEAPNLLEFAKQDFSDTWLVWPVVKGNEVPEAYVHEMRNVMRYLREKESRHQHLTYVLAFAARLSASNKLKLAAEIQALKAPALVAKHASVMIWDYADIRAANRLLASIH